MTLRLIRCLSVYDENDDIADRSISINKRSSTVKSGNVFILNQLNMKSEFRFRCYNTKGKMVSRAFPLLQNWVYSTCTLISRASQLLQHYRYRTVIYYLVNQCQYKNLRILYFTRILRSNSFLSVKSFFKYLTTLKCWNYWKVKPTCYFEIHFCLCRICLTDIQPFTSTWYVL